MINKRCNLPVCGLDRRKEGFLTANLEEMNWHTFAVDSNNTQQTLIVIQCEDKGCHFSFRSKLQEFQTGGLLYFPAPGCYRCVSGVVLP